MWTKADQELVIPTGMSLLLFYHLLTASNFMCRLQSLHRFFLTNVNVFYEFLAFSFFPHVLTVCYQRHIVTFAVFLELPCELCRQG